MLIDKIIKKEFRIDFFSKKEVINLLDDKHYTDNFGFQWNIFDKDQLDSINKTNLSQKRFDCTKWKLADVKNKNILEVGSGAGRFTEIFAKTKCNLFTMDSSSAIYSNFKNNCNNDFYFIKCNIEKDIFEDECFDYVFCYGVIQHTEKPFRTLDFLIKKLKPGGKLSVDFYRKVFFPAFYSTPKYIWRKFTKNLNDEKLLNFIKFYIPLYLPIDTFIKKIFGKFSIVICGLIPIPCYQDWTKEYLSLDKKLRIELAILDTFDALSPRYDFPFTKKQISKYLKRYNNISFDLSYGSNGIVLNLTKT